jgi:hypothetical protein
MKYYKNLRKHVIQVNLYGHGDIKIPADAACVPLEESVAKAINAMTAPMLTLVETSPVYTTEDTPIIKTPKKRNRTR